MPTPTPTPPPLHHTPTTQATSGATRFGPGQSTLWASALVLTALIIMQASRVVPAQAEMVASDGDFTMMTTDAGTEEALFVLDNRAEMLSAYIVVNQSSLQLQDRLSLPKVFSDARARTTGLP